MNQYTNYTNSSNSVANSGTFGGNHSSNSTSHQLPPVDEDASFIYETSNRLAQKAVYIRGLAERLGRSSSGIQRSTDTVETLAAKSGDLGGELALEYVLQQVQSGDNEKRGKLSQAQTLLQTSMPIISNLGLELEGRQGVLHDILNSGCIDAPESSEVHKMIDRARIMQMKIKRCALTLSFLTKILNSQSIALSYVSELIQSYPLSCEATRRITAAVLLHYFFNADVDDSFEIIRYSMLNFQGLRGQSDLKQRAKESLQHSISSEPLANGLFDFIYMVVLNNDWNEKIFSKAIVFQDAIRDNLKKAVEGSLIENVNHFFVKDQRNPYERLVKPNHHAWHGANLEGKCSCLAIILGIIESGEGYAGFTLQFGFTKSPPNADKSSFP
jgi:hypothetical protein